MVRFVLGIMDPSVQTNRRSREIIFAQATTANARASKRLTVELKTLENQKQREMVKLHNAKFRMKTAISMPSLHAGQDNGGCFHGLISPRAPSSLPVSPIASPRIPRRRHSEVMTPSTRSLQFKCQPLANQSNDFNNNRLSRASSEGKLDDTQEKESVFTMKEINYAGVSPRPFRRSLSDITRVSNPGMPLKGQELFTMKNRAPKTPLLASRARKLSAPLIAIDENRDNLDQRIKKFHESFLSYKREKDAEDEVFDEGGTEDADFSDSVPTLPDIKPNTSRTNSLPGLVPRLSLANLTLNSSVGDDDSVENLKKCRYLRIPDASELTVAEIFSQEED